MNRITFPLTCLMLLSIFETSFGKEPEVIKVGTKPESVCRGFADQLFVTMINGDEPGDGGIDIIDGNNVKTFCRGMNAPKGIAFVGGYLVTADETTVWKVDAKGKATKLVGKEDFPNPVEFLNDVAASLDGKSVYVTEMGHPKWMFDPDGERQLWPLDSDQAKPPMKGCVYRITLDGEITLAAPAGDPAMPGPNGVTVTGTADKELLVMGDFFTGNIVTYDGESYSIIAKGMRGADAVAIDGDMIYVSSWPLGKVWKFDRKSKKLTVLSDQFTTVADFFYDRANRQLVIPDMLAGTVTFLPLD